MRTSSPDHGWYWLGVGQSWYMAFVNMDNETVSLFKYPGTERTTMSLDEVYGDWYGPITCPDPDETVILPKELHDQAQDEGKVICLEHYDFTHCKEYVVGTFTLTELRDKGDIAGFVSGREGE